MVRLATLALMAVGVLRAQSPVFNYSISLGGSPASAAALDSAGNAYVVSGTALIQVGPDGTVLGQSTPVPDKTLNAIAIDSQDRVVVAGNGFVARPPDFVTEVPGSVLQLAVDRTGAIWAATSVPALIQLTGDGAILSTRKVGGASMDKPVDLVIDNAGSPYLALVTNSAELPASGFQPLLNGVPGAVSYDGGAYFYPVFAVTAAINHWLLTDSNTVYVATRGQGVARSVDRGQTFTDRGTGLPDTTVNMLAVDPTNTQIMYAATAKGLAKSANGGVTWSTLTMAATTAVAVSPANRAHVYAAAGCAVYRSTDSGATWVAQTLGACVTSFLVDPTDVNGVYAVANGELYVYGPTSWTRVSTLPSLTAVVADPVTFTTWYAIADGIYKSTDKGAAWTQVLPGAFTALSAGRPYIVAGTNTGALTISRDGGATWNAGSTPPFSQPVRSLLSDSGTIFAGATYNPGIWLGKYSPLDGQLLSSTFLGGTGSETAARLAVDSQGAVTVAMESDSSDAPTTLDAAQRRPSGGVDIVITRLTPAFGLQYASYFGGAGDESIGGIKLDPQGFLYLAGSRRSPDTSAFAAVFNPSANGLVYSADFNGTRGLAFLPDAKGNAVLVTRSASDSQVISLTGLIGYQTLGAIRNAATLATGPIAPGSLVTIEGSFGALSGISVTFNGIAASVVHADDISIVVAVPDGLPAGNATVAIQSGQGLTQGAVAVAPVVPGFFSANSDGKGVALATLVRVFADGSQDNEPVFQCDATCVGLPIDFGNESDTLYLQLTATGLRNETDPTQFQVTVGGQPATVVSVGPQGTSPGRDQLTIQLPRPADGLSGPAVWNILLTVDGQTSNVVTITVG